MVNTDYDLAWEDLHLVLQHIDKSALDSGSRNHYLAFLQGNIHGVETTIRGMKEIADKSNGVFKNEDGSIDLKLDQDIMDLISLHSDSEGADKALKYLTECLSCDLRASFDFQIQKLSLLKPFEDILDQLEATFNQMQMHLDPMNKLAEICSLLNDFDAFCLQDITMMIMSLKMLIKQYALKGFNIKLDWTVILAPILKLIVSFISAIVDGLFALLAGPSDCISAAVMSIVALEESGRELAGQVTSFAKGFDFNSKEDLERALGAAVTTKTFSATATTQPSNMRGPQAPKISQLSVTRGTTETNPLGTVGGKTTAPTGFTVKAGLNLEEAMKDPKWATASAKQQIAVTLNTGKAYIHELGDNIKQTLNSLGNLVSGGQALSIQLGGILLLITDLISLLMMVARLKGLNLDVKDWCSYLEANPKLLEDQIAKEFGPVELSLDTSKERTSYLIKKTK